MLENSQIFVHSPCWDSRHTSRTKQHRLFISSGPWSSVEIRWRIKANNGGLTKIQMHLLQTQYLISSEQDHQSILFLQHLETVHNSINNHGKPWWTHSDSDTIPPGMSRPHISKWSSRNPSSLQAFGTVINTIELRCNMVGSSRELTKIWTLSPLSDSRPHISRTELWSTLISSGLTYLFPWMQYHPHMPSSIWKRTWSWQSLGVGVTSTKTSWAWRQYHAHPHH